MVPLAWIDSKIVVKGIITGPNLHIKYPSNVTSNKTITYFLVDQALQKLTDPATVTLTSGRQIDVNIGDYVDAQWTIKGLYPSMVFLYVEVVDSNTQTVENLFLFPIWLSEVSTSFPVEGLDVRNLKYIIIIDKVTGDIQHLPNTVTRLPADSRYELWAYYYDKERDMGRLVKFDMFGVILDTGYHRAVILTQTLEFNSWCDLAKYLLVHSVDMPINIIMQIQEEIQHNNCQGVVNIMLPYLWRFGLPGMLTISVEQVSGKVKLYIKNFVRLGFLDSFQKILPWATAGCVLAGIGAGVFTAMTVGFGTPVLLGALGGCGIGATTGIISKITIDRILGSNDDTAEAIKKHADTIKTLVNEGKQKNDSYYTNAKTILDQWLNQGKITQGDYDKMMNILTAWKTDIDSILDDIGKNADAIKKLAEQVEEAKKWYLIGGALAGGVGGYLLGRKKAIETR